MWQNLGVEDRLITEGSRSVGGGATVMETLCCHTASLSWQLQMWGGFL